jgi:hypothetical protein
VGLLALTGGGCRAHTQDLALDQAAMDFHDSMASQAKTKKGASWKTCLQQMQTLSSGDPGAAPISYWGVPADVRPLLTPWITGPNQYLVEGCAHQARYICTSDACRRDGQIEAAKAFVAAATPPRAASAAAPEPAAREARGEDANESALRAALDARRSEIAGCVDHLPLGIKVDYIPGTAPVISLRGELRGKPEEACVRSVLKDLGTSSVTGAVSMIHVVK